MLAIFLLPACGLDVGALFEACQSPPDTGTVDPVDDAELTDTDDDLDGPIVDTDAGAMVVSIEGTEYVATSVIIVPIEGDPINVPNAVSLTAATGGTLTIGNVCCSANGEDLSLELLAYRATGNATAALTEARELELSNLRDASRDGVTLYPGDMESLFSFEARTLESEVWNQPLFSLGSSGYGGDGTPQSIIGITIEVDIAAGDEGDQDGGVDVLTTGLGVVSDGCQVELLDEGGTVATWQGQCDAVRFPIEIVPMEGATDAVIGFAVRAGDPSGSSIEFAVGLVGREAGSGMATGK